MHALFAQSFIDWLGHLGADRTVLVLLAHATGIGAFVFMQTDLREDRLEAGRRPVTPPPKAPKPRGAGTIAVTDTLHGMTDAAQRIAGRLRELDTWKVVADAGPYDQPERPRALIVVLDESWNPSGLAADDSEMGKLLLAMRRAGVRIVPVQVGEHRMPHPTQLPAALSWFAWSNAQTVDLGSLEADVGALAEELRR